MFQHSVVETKLTSDKLFGSLFVIWVLIKNNNIGINGSVRILRENNIGSRYLFSKRT